MEIIWLVYLLYFQCFLDFHLWLKDLADKETDGQTEYVPKQINNRICESSKSNWKTNSENNGADKKRDGTENPPKGERNGSAKLTEAKVLEIRQKYATKEYTQQELAMEYGVNPPAISKIILRQTWHHI